MKKYLIFLLIISFSAVAKLNELQQIVDSELKEVIKLNKQLGARDPELLLRLSELYLEKARIIREIENGQFLKISPRKRRRIDKNKFFKRSKGFFVKSQKVAYFILKKYKRFKEKGSVYFILAYNAQEFKKTSMAKKFFLKAIENSSRRSTSYLRSSLALGSIYYNQKRYPEAIEYLERGLKDKSSQWWAKDAFNLAWSYFRVKRYKKAIALMKEVTKEASGNIANDAKRDLALFFTEAGRTRDALRYFKNDGRAYSGLMGVAKNLISQGKKSKAIDVLKSLDSGSLTPERMREVSETMLPLLLDFGRFEEHLNYAKKLHESLTVANDETALEILLFQVKKSRSIVQKKVADGRYDDQQKYLKKLATLNEGLGQILIQRESKKRHSQIYFFNGEIFFAAKDYEQSFSSYKKSYGLRKSKKVLENMMACLGKMSNESEIYKSDSTFVFEEYLKVERDLKKKKKVIPLIFSNYIALNNVEKAGQWLRGYSRLFRKDYKVIESMLAKLMEHPKIKGDRASYLSWAKRVSVGEFKVSNEFKSIVKNNALNLQFKSVEESSSKGKKIDALKGYFQIYKDSLSSASARRNAAYNMAVLFHSLRYPKSTYDWAKKSLNLMTPSEVNNLIDSFGVFAHYLFEHNRHSWSLDLYELIFKKSCTAKPKKGLEGLVKDYLRIGFAVGVKNKRLWNGACLTTASSKRLFQEYVIQKYLDANNFSGLFNAVKNFDYSSSSYELISQVTVKFLKRDTATALKIAKLYLKKTKGKSRKFFQSVISFVELKKMALSLRKRKLAFPEKRFNSRLKEKLTTLGKMNKLTVETAKKGSSILFASLYDELVNAYTYVANEVDQFSPAKKSQEYIKSFKAEMEKVVDGLDQQRDLIFNQVKVMILDKKLRTLKGENFTGEFNQRLPVAFDYEQKMILIDRGIQ